jgi:hypothetical protein
MNVLDDDLLLLPRLLIGFEALRERYGRREFYPYPETLRVAWNALSVRLIATKPTSVPVALSDLIILCTQPTGNWYPGTLPQDWPSEARILRTGGGIELTDWASMFLTEQILRRENVRSLADAEQVELVLQNDQFARMLDALRQSKHPERAQSDYVLLRRFLITNPFTQRSKISEHFSPTSLRPSDVGAFYVDCQEGRTYHCCQNCGPLFPEHGRWRGAKPDVCSNHVGPEEQSPTRVPFGEGLCYLCAAIHKRVCLHGITEVRWLDAVHQLQIAKPNRIVVVEDWPGIDTYDLRVTFADGHVWAADMKDHRYTEILAPQLEALASPVQSLEYDEAFYVIPDRREARDPGYCQRLRVEANLPHNHRILTESEFLAAVETRASRRAKKERAR